MNAVACKTTRGHVLNSGIAKFSISTVVMYHGMHVICFAYEFSLFELACYLIQPSLQFCMHACILISI